MNLAEAIVTISTDERQLKKGLARAEKDTNRSAYKMSRSFDMVSTKLSTIGNQLTNIGKSMTLKGALGLGAVAAGMTGILKPAANLEESLLNVSTLFSDTEADIGGFTKEILNLSRVVPKNTKTLTEALFQIKSAGIEAENMFGFLKVAAVSATAGVNDVESTVRALTKTLEGYGLESTDVLKVSNKMFKTVEKGQTTFAELAESLPTITAASANVGLSIDEMMGAFAAGTKILVSILSP